MVLARHTYSRSYLKKLISQPSKLFIIAQTIKGDKPTDKIIARQPGFALLIMKKHKFLLRAFRY